MSDFNNDYDEDELMEAADTERKARREDRPGTQREGDPAKTRLLISNAPSPYPEEALAEAARILHLFGCVQGCEGDPSGWRENAVALLDAVLPLLREGSPAGPLTIYECPDCGAQMLGKPKYPHIHGDKDTLVPVRVFREEDVRPLWDLIDRALRGDVAVMFGARNGVGARATFIATRDAFPAPEGW